MGCGATTSPVRGLSESNVLRRPPPARRRWRGSGRPGPPVMLVRHVVAPDQVGCLLGDHDGRGIGVAAGHGRHDRGVDDTQALDAAHPQVGVDHGIVAGAHRARRGRVERRLGVLPDVVDELLVGRGSPAARTGGRAASDICPCWQISMIRRVPASMVSRSAWSSKYAASIAGCHDGSAERSRTEPRLLVSTSVESTVTCRLVGSVNPSPISPVGSTCAWMSGAAGPRECGGSRRTRRGWT